MRQKVKDSRTMNADLRYSSKTTRKMKTKKKKRHQLRKHNMRRLILQNLLKIAIS
jgi:hypothetical protein